MKLFLKTVAIGFCFQAISTLAEPVTVPHTFVPGTPAKSAEVNENIQALASAIQGMKHISLYQNNVLIGKPLVLTLMKLNSGYLTIVTKDRDSSNIYVKRGDDALYYPTNNCSGAMYVAKTLKMDLISGETGVVADVGSVAISLQLPTTATLNFFYNSVKMEGVCYDVSAYVAPTVQPCIDQMNQNNMYGSNVHRAKQVDLGGGNYDCQWLKWYAPTGLRVHEDILSKAYPVQLNNPAVSGITTSACVDVDGAPAVCVPNGELRSE